MLMLKKMMFAGFAALALVAAHGARAAGNDTGGFTESHFSDNAAVGLQDPAAGNTASDANAAAAASIEPAAGVSENVFTTTQVGNASSSGAAQPTAQASDSGEPDPMTMTVYP